MELSTEESIERTIRGLHPSGRYEDLSPDRLDAHLAVRQLESVVGQVNATPEASADLEMAAQSLERRHILHVTEKGRPSWHQFNRFLTDEARVNILRRQGALLYWNIRLSRVGPFCTSYWNEFVLRRGIITPELSSSPTGDEWKRIIRSVEAILAASGLTWVPPDLLERPIPWLFSTADYLLESRRRFPGPTAYHVLFGDLY
jgi:hypothetical protein